MKLVRFLLFPFAVIYNLITSIRNLLFKFQVLQSESFRLPVIVVGNLSVGGTGKTPQIEYLVRYLKKQYKIAILSRGYKRKTKGFLLLDASHSYLDSGDEPMQFFNKFSDITVAVDEKRVRGIQNLIDLKSPDIILLDDAYQHRKVKGSFYILLTKFDDLFVDDFLLPTGNLREGRRGAHRSDVIVVTKSPQNLSLNQQNIIDKKLSLYKKPVFFTSIKYSENLKGSIQNLSISDLKGYEILLITGIANPTSLLRFLSDKGVAYKHLEFADHHNFTQLDIDHIQKEFHLLKSSNKVIVTTEKDYTRLSKSLVNMVYIEIETYFLSNGNVEFDKLLTNHIKQNRH